MSDGQIKRGDLITTDAEKVYENLADSASKSLGEIVKAIEIINKSQGKFNITSKESIKLEKEKDELTKKFTSDLRALKIAQEKVNLSIKNQTLANKKATSESKKHTKAVEKQTKSTKTLTLRFKELLRSMIAFIGVRMFIQSIKDTFSLIKILDSLRFSMKKVAKTIIDVKDNMVFLVRISRAYGVSLLTITNRYIKFLAAAQQSNVSLKDTQNIFESMVKVSAVLGLKTDELNGVFLALEQMLSKGKVTTEELRRQLGERLPGAMGIMASALGVTIPKLDAMLKKGEVLSAETLPKFAKAVELAYGIKSVRKVETLISKQERLKNTWVEFVSAVSNGDSLISQALKNTFDGLNKILRLLGKAVSDPIIELQNKVIDETVSFNNKIEKEAVKNTEKITKIKRENLVKQLSDAKKNIEKSINLSKKEKDIAEKNLSIKLKALLDFDDKVDVEKKKIAKKQFNVARADFLTQKENFDKLLKAKDEALKKLNEKDPAILRLAAKFSGGFKIIEKLKGKEVKKLKDTYEQSLLDLNAYLDDFSKSSAKFQELRKLVSGESKITVKPKSDKFKEFEDNANKLRIEQLKGEILNNKRILDDDNATWDAKIKAAKENTEKLKEISALSTDDIIAKLEISRRKEISKIGNTGAKLVDINKSYNSKISSILQKAKNEQFKLESDLINKISDLGDKQIVIARQRIKEETTLIKASLQEKLNAINKEFKGRKKTQSVINEITLKTKKAEHDASVEIANVSAIIFEEVLKGLDKTNPKYKELLSLIKLLRAEGEKPFIPPTKLEREAEALSKLASVLSQVGQGLGIIAQIASNSNDARIAQIESEITAEEEKYARLKELAINDSDTQKALDDELESRRKELKDKENKEKVKAFKTERDFKLANIVLETAISVMRAKATSLLLPPGVGTAWFIGQKIIIGSLAALQTVALLSAKVPKFAKGGTMKYDGQAMINDGGKKEFVQRGSNIFSTDSKNAIVDLQKGDIVHKDYDALLNASIIHSIASGSKLNTSDISNVLKQNYNNLEGALTKVLKNTKSTVNLRTQKIDLRRDLRNIKKLNWE